jgi:diguanylate cyclase (GGDEF)-like protein
VGTKVGRWWRNLPLLSKGHLVLAAPLLALAISCAVFLAAVNEVAQSNHVVDGTEDVRTEVERILALLVDAETGVRGFLLTAEREFLEPYHAAIDELPGHRASLKRSVSGDAEMMERQRALSHLIDRRLAVFSLTLATRSGRTGMLETGKAVMDEIRRQVSEMETILTASLLRAESAEESAVARARWAALGSVLLGSFGGYAGIRIFVGGVARGVRRNTENAERLAQGEALREAPRGADEIGRSGRALATASERLAERERTIRESEHLLRLILESIGDGVVVADPDGRFVLFNDAAERILGVGALERDPAEWSATYGVVSATGEPYPPQDLPLARALRGESVDGLDLVVHNPHRSGAVSISISGRPVVDEEGKTRAGVVIFRDVTDEREGERRLEAYRIELEQLNEELHALATKDPLTGLSNRRGFEPVAEQLIRLAERRAEELSLLFIDLDGLKDVNDRLGHDVGSQMIVDAASAIRTIARVSDVPARMGGDEFCIMLTGGSGVARRMASRLQEHVARFNATSPRPYQLSMSIGSATSTPVERLSLDEMMRAADAAMYEDKRARRADRSRGSRTAGLADPS